MKICSYLFFVENAILGGLYNRQNRTHTKKRNTEKERSPANNAMWWNPFPSLPCVMKFPRGGIDHVRWNAPVDGILQMESGSTAIRRHPGLRMTWQDQQKMRSRFYQCWRCCVFVDVKWFGCSLSLDFIWFFVCCHLVLICAGTMAWCAQCIVTRLLNKEATLWLENSDCWLARCSEIADVLHTWMLLDMHTKHIKWCFANTAHVASVTKVAV